MQHSVHFTVEESVKNLLFLYCPFRNSSRLTVDCVHEIESTVFRNLILVSSKLIVSIRVQCKDVVLEDTDVAKAITEFVTNAAVEKLVIGSSSRSGFVRSTDLSTTICKGVPDFCTVYIISKGKVSSMRNAVRPPPPVSLLRNQIQGQASVKPDTLSQNAKNGTRGPVPSDAALTPWNLQKDNESIK
ncbi:hypothetical protein C4D60_Mb04t04580 [Musa balbisiana]|uniref:RING-type E3 ubiquitin transferase n=1 Tax=Musa balbisiana TaxID=52838 RepID=A0A4S8K9M6_MUSBA|nr:hypothetical protein C4D60_Mb04t04580 [Musa balbisiana]